jgi:predicted transglutaminase-like cysteine proteinase
MQPIIGIAVLLAALVFATSDRLADPYGGETVYVAYGPLAGNWRNVVNKLAGDDALLGACVDSNTLECAPARQLWTILEDAKAQQGLALVGHINRAINLAITPVAPSPWLSAVEAINADGDCKAYATAKYFALIESGMAPNRVRLVVVHQNGHREDHIVVAVWVDRWLILDNVTLIMAPDNQTRYTPLYVLDLHGVRGYSVPVS